jgi:ribosomal protein L37AE/L43A
MKKEIKKIAKELKQVEFLPPPEKPECPDCKIKFRKLHKCRDGIKRCKNCKNKLVTNKFYIPPEERKRNFNGISNFNISDAERKIMYDNLIRQGLSTEAAQKKINSRIRMLKATKSRKYRFAVNKRKEKSDKKKADGELNKKFKESFKNLE